jgi:hypothetical protein
MNQLTPSTPVRVGVGIAFSLLAAGCATSSDLQKFNLDLNHKLDAQTRTLRGETSSLRDEAKSLKTEQESLRAQVGTFHFAMKTALERLKEQEVIRVPMVKELTASGANIRKAREAYGAKSSEHFGKIEVMTG